MISIGGAYIGPRGKAGPPGSVGIRGLPGNAYRDFPSNEEQQIKNLVEIDTKNNDTLIVKKISNIQSGQWEWIANIVSEQNYSYSIHTDPYGNAYVIGHYVGNITLYNADQSVGFTLEHTDSGYDVFVAKISPRGKWLWVTRIVGNTDDYGIDINLDTDNNCIVSGYFANTNLTFYNIDQTVGLTTSGGSPMNGFIGKISGDGIWLWSAVIENVTVCDLQFISVDYQNNCYVTGTYSDSIVFKNSNDTVGASLSVPYGTDAYIGKIDSTGTWEWSLHISNFNADIPFRIDFNAKGDGYVIVAAYENTPTFYNIDGSYVNAMYNSGFINAYVGKLSRNGFWMWTTSIGSSTLSAIQSIKIDHQDNGYMIGLFDATDPLFSLILWVM